MSDLITTINDSLADLANAVKDGLGRFEPQSTLDILIIAALIYGVLILLRQTTAESVLRGIGIIVIAALILARLLDLTVVNWLLRNSFPALLIAFPIIFQPEIRRALERVGRTGLRGWLGRPVYDEVIDIVAQVCQNLAAHRHGALLVLERETGLEEYIDTGIRVDASPSAQLLEGIFFPNSPLHDGAVILRENRVVAASCTLPLSENIARGGLGTRHRAALGITERTDAVSVVVSEETGRISLASNGRLITSLDDARLRALLNNLCGHSAGDRSARRNGAS